jgi:signal transduction histidine kinase
MYAISFFLMLCAFGTVRWWMFTHYVDGQVDASIASVVTDVAQSPEYSGLVSMPGASATPTTTGSAASTPTVRPKYERVSSGVFYLVIDDASGAVVSNRRNVDPSAFVALDVAARAERGETARDTVHIAGHRYRLMAAPVLVDGARVGTVLAAEDMADSDGQVQSTRASFLVGAAIGLVAALGVRYVLAGRALRPIVVAYDQQRTFVADASHELRAPITVIRASADLLLGEDLTEDHRTSLEEIRDVAVEASHLVAALLELARLQEPNPNNQASADVALVAQEECAALGTLVEQHGTRITFDLVPAMARASTMEVRLLVRTLVENVLAHTPPGTPAQISTRLAGPNVHFVVEDGGPGVAPTALPSIFERFSKGSAARTTGAGEGYGLGLAIVNEIARRNSGSVQASESLLGGLRIAVTLPLAVG